MLSALGVAVLVNAYGVVSALPKGPLADGHCLLLPIAHAASFAELPESVLAELER